MAALPYMPLYVADYKADTAHLTLVERGAYMELILNYWQTGKPLNNKNERLAKIIGINLKSWLKIKFVVSEFFTIEDDIWTHGRIEFELQKVHEKSTKASYAASEGARKRASERLANAERNPSHTDTDTDTDNRYNSRFEEFWKIFPRHEGSKKNAKEQYEKALKKITHEGLLEAVNRLMASKPDPKFIKHAERWLRDERWNDEIVTAKPSQSPFIITEPTFVPKLDPRSAEELNRPINPMPSNLAKELRQRLAQNKAVIDPGNVQPSIGGSELEESVLKPPSKAPREDISA